MAYTLFVYIILISESFMLFDKMTLKIQFLNTVAFHVKKNHKKGFHGNDKIFITNLYLRVLDLCNNKRSKTSANDTFIFRIRLKH